VNNKPIIIIAGEPYSIFFEIYFKIFKSNFINSYKRPLIIIGSKLLMIKQMKKLNYNYKIKLLDPKKISSIKISNKQINLINVNFDFKKTFDKITNKSKNYIEKCFKIALKLMKDKVGYALINGPINKKAFLSKKFLGITEYLAFKTNSENKTTMLIYNDLLSVCPITTHLPLKDVAKKISKEKIIKNVKTIDNFYKTKLNKKPKIAVSGLNPHCETNHNFKEEEKIIKPAINFLKKKKINIKGPYSADTLFLKKNLKEYDVIIGMYHDQVLTPIKTLFGFDAVNLTLGLPFIRLSPDHGPNNKMLGKNKSDPKSLIKTLSFLKKIRAN
jgi:4-hydroxythreonine-4-phosphate dehydrogenase